MGREEVGVEWEERKGDNHSGCKINEIFLINKK